jgi:glycosyltransferase involved in cell wall biosynthesis
MKISFVVPTRNSARTLESCLRSLRTQTHPDIEIVVVDNESTDDTVDIARRLADAFATCTRERSAQRNEGTARSTGDVVVFVDSDMVLEPRVAAAVHETFEAQPQLGALVIPERSFGVGFLAGCRVLEKELYVGNSDIEAPRAFRRSVIDAVGGWNEDLRAGEDWDLSERTAAASVHIGRIDAWIWHDEGRIRLRGTFAKKRYYGHWFDRYLSADAGRGRRRFARTSVLRQPARLLRSPLRTAGMVGLKTVEAAGLLAGIRQARRGRPEPGAAP